MTTYQDPPLQSRRAVRQGERADPPFTPPQTPRSAAGAGEPLSYVTQNRPPLPGYDAAPSHGRRSAVPAPAPQAVPEQPGQQSFRARDFSPEARTAPPAWAPEYDRDSGMLDHHTQVRAAALPQPGVSLAESLASEPNEQTLTRRELRAIRDTHHIEAVPTEANPVREQPAAYQPGPTQPASAQQAPHPAPPAPAPSMQLDSAMAEFDALAGRSAPSVPAPSRRAGRRAAPNSDVAPEDGLGAFDAMLGTSTVQPAVVQPAVVQPAAQPAPVRPAPVQPTPVQPTPEQVAPVQPASGESVAVTTGERPVGHWTTQSDIDDRTQVNESTISRRVGSGAITTSALVLPQIPGHNMSTGEVMLTDSISLPSSLAATGAHSPIDESDIDHLLDPGDHQLVNTDSVPIRAIRAVSSHTGSRNQLITTTKPAHGNRALTALIVSASGMVVVVVTLLVVALATEVI